MVTCWVGSAGAGGVARRRARPHMTYGGPAAGRGYWTKLANRRRHALQVGVHFRLVRASRSPHREPSAGRWSASPRVISCGSGRAFGQRSYHTISR